MVQSGPWNDEGHAADLVVASAWYQSTWFLVVCAAMAGGAAWLAYRIGRRQVTGVPMAGRDEQDAEQARLARDLHETLLQTVQGAKLVADEALERPQDADGMRRAMAQLSTWLGQAATAGCSPVHAVRGAALEGNDLPAAFQRAIADCGRWSPMIGVVSVSGNVRELNPVIRDEVYRIGYEAIRNACVHSHGLQLLITLSYAEDLTLRVADNGVGMDRLATADGRPGHCGLQNMRERAGRIGATLSIASDAHGTQVLLTVPGRAIFTPQ